LLQTAASALRSFGHKKRRKQDGEHEADENGDGKDFHGCVRGGVVSNAAAIKNRTQALAPPCLV